ncbi:MAG: hypothetical protein JW715_00770 [Sedimentisphaerales bacterium]|nr:hypothetical protein [Sedimentisphaerales bacterium]
MMKKHNQYQLPAIIVAAIFMSFGNLCMGQARDDEIVYYNNPDIISNRLVDNNDNSQKSGIETKKDTEVVFAEVEQAKKRLTIKDDFIKSLSPFDRSARLKTDKFVSEKEFLEHLANQVQPWTVGETVRIRAIIKSIAKRFKGFDLDFPDKVYLIKTTGAEEGRAAYCRSNAIILPQQMLMQQNADLEKLLIHELCHVLLSNNSNVKESLYRVINFKKCNDIELPQKLRDVKITNPDGVKNDHYVEVKYKDAVVQVVPIIYSSSAKYNVAKGGEFFRYLRMNLLIVEKDGDKWLCKRDNAGEPVLLELQDVPDYFEKIGFNTDYVVHPDEIIAENFVLLVQGAEPVKSKWVIERMRKLLQNKVEAGVGLN